MYILFSYLFISAIYIYIGMGKCGLRKLERLIFLRQVLVCCSFCRKVFRNILITLVGFDRSIRKESLFRVGMGFSLERILLRGLETRNFPLGLETRRYNSCQIKLNWKSVTGSLAFQSFLKPLLCLFTFPIWLSISIPVLFLSFVSSAVLYSWAVLCSSTACAFLKQC